VGRARINDRRAARRQLQQTRDSRGAANRPAGSYRWRGISAGLASADLVTMGHAPGPPEALMEIIG